MPVFSVIDTFAFLLYKIVRWQWCRNRRISGIFFVSGIPAWKRTFIIYIRKKGKDAAVCLLVRTGESLRLFLSVERNNEVAL